MSAIDTYLSALNGWKIQAPDTKEELAIDQQALEEAALHHDHPGFIEALIDELSQPLMRDAFIRQCQDIVESTDDTAVNPAFARAVLRVAIEFFGEPT